MAGVVAPLGAALFSALMSITPAYQGFGPNTWMVMLLATYQFGLFFEVLLVTPILIVTARLQPIRWWNCGLAGAGFALGISVFLFHGQEPVNWAVAGTASGLTFWATYAACVRLWSRAPRRPEP